MNDINPFSQAEQHFQVHVETSKPDVSFIENMLEGEALAVSSFEEDEEKEQWKIDAIFPFDPTDLVEHIKDSLASLYNIALDKHTITPLHHKDWVSEVQKSFKPIHAGQFFVHGTHYESDPPENTIPIVLDAGAAFGTGEHQTTHGCLEAIDWLAQSCNFSHMLDMGCGSGILAMAMAKVWHAPVLAVDIDEVSVSVAHENMKHNDANYLVSCQVGDGYRAPHVEGPYDLIVANILAKPLIAMASDLKKNLAQGGYVVLAGLLDRQESLVLNAHEHHGLQLVKRIQHDEWPTLILKAS